MYSHNVKIIICDGLLEGLEIIWDIRKKQQPGV